MDIFSFQDTTKDRCVVEGLFQLRGRGHPQNDATPNIFPDSKFFTAILGYILKRKNVPGK